MKQSEIILNELKEISSTVADIAFTNVYKVREDYFTGIHAEFEARMAAKTFYSKEQNFTVPDGYFERLTSNIFDRIRKTESEVFAETNAISPVVAAIANRNIYSTPENYFELLAFENNERSEAKVVKMNGARTFFKYAAAAVVVGLLGVGIFKMVDKPTTINGPAVAMESNSVMQEANAILKSKSFDATLASVSDSDIEQYLKQNGQDVQAALVASTIDDADKLPEATDYLLDENALDNYLQENNLKN